MGGLARFLLCGGWSSGRRGSHCLRQPMKMRSNWFLILGSLSLSLWSVSSARADSLQECGGVFLEASAQCEFRPKEECMTECVTVAVETSCAAKIYTECESSCTATAETSCEATCTETCNTDCVAVAEPPNCMGLCRSDCAQACPGDCADSERKGPCQACCSHNCNDKCEAKCKDAPPAPEPMDCMPTCTTACSGSCTAKANVMCQVSCQTDVYTQCETEMVEKCETDCMTTGGAIFCEGQFMSASDINACADELAAEVDIHVEVMLEVDASVDVDLSGGGKDDDGDGDGDSVISCSLSDAGTGTGSLPAALTMLGLAGVLYRRRARNPRAH